jgi:hypothetical protein
MKTLYLFLVIAFSIFIIFIALALVVLCRKPYIIFEPRKLNYIPIVRIDETIKDKLSNISFNLFNLFFTYAKPTSLGLDFDTFDNIVLNYSKAYSNYSYNVVNITNILTAYLKGEKENKVNNIYFKDGLINVQNIFTFKLKGNATFNIDAKLLSFKRKGSVVMKDPIIYMVIVTSYYPHLYFPSSYKINKIVVKGDYGLSNFSIFSPIVNYVLANVLESNVIGDRLVTLLEKGNNYISYISSILEEFNNLTLIQVIEYLITQAETLVSLLGPDLSKEVIDALNIFKESVNFLYDLGPIYVIPYTSYYNSLPYPDAGLPLLSLNKDEMYNIKYESEEDIKKAYYLFKYVSSVICDPYSLVYSNEIQNKDIVKLLSKC